MMMSADKVGGWVKKGQNHDDVILEWSLFINVIHSFIYFTEVHKCFSSSSLYFALRRYIKCYIMNANSAGFMLFFLNESKHLFLLYKICTTLR